MIDLPLTDGERRALCVHEAGHATVLALGGFSVYCVAVAPVGAPMAGPGVWTYRGRKGLAAFGDVWGMCERVESHLADYCYRWDPFEGYFVAEPSELRQIMRPLSPRHRLVAWRQLRAVLAGTLAGPIAEQIHKGEAPEFFIDEWDGSPDDAKKASALERLLPWRNEIDPLHAIVVETLRQPEVWGSVLRLADALEQRGEVVDDIAEYLPQPLASWPPSPRARCSATGAPRAQYKADARPVLCRA